MTTALITPGNSTTWSFGEKAPTELVDTTILMAINEVSEILALSQKPEESSLGDERIARAAAIIAAQACHDWAAMIGKQPDPRHKAAGAIWATGKNRLLNAVNNYDKSPDGRTASAMGQAVIAWLTATHHAMVSPASRHRAMVEYLHGDGDDG